ncbi:MAG: DUF2231 domain-containing protein [bacterium]
MSKTTAMLESSHFHPMTVHFPIAIILIGFLIDLISVFSKKEPCFSRMSYYLEIIGMVAAIVAFGTGYYFTSPMQGEAGLIRDEHKLFATLTLVFIILATTFRVLLVYLKKEETYLMWIARGFYLMSFIFVAYTGYLGGHMVMDYMIGL